MRLTIGMKLMLAAAAGLISLGSIVTMPPEPPDVGTDVVLVIEDKLRLLVRPAALMLGDHHSYRQRRRRHLGH
ncbi:hypothetical protein [Micromonospora sp. NPDC051296]|uniref:hypothetical protein n=1 Tax=Micromonospora sp. NPDC051296 TaxID=3155046 RepID=UPI003427C788